MMALITPFPSGPVPVRLVSKAFSASVKTNLFITGRVNRGMWDIEGETYRCVMRGLTSIFPDDTSEIASGSPRNTRDIAQRGDVTIFI
jgi:hypothetical protein